MIIFILLPVIAKQEIFGQISGTADMYSSSYSSHAARHLGLRHQDTYVRYNSYPQLADCYEKKDQLIEKVHTTFPWVS